MSRRAHPGICHRREAEICLQLAQRAAAFGRRNGHDNRTLFLAAELRGNLELLAAGDASIDPPAAHCLGTGIDATPGKGYRRDYRGYFTEADAADGFRSIAFAADPALTLLRIWELRSMLPDTAVAEQARQAVFDYIENYLLADCGSNPFSLTPYGVYFDPPHRDRQLFRDAGSGRGVRTFMAPVQFAGHRPWDELSPHEPRASARPGGRAVEPASVARAAERLLHWCLGHNTLNRSLFSGIGYRQPVGYSFRIPQIPEAMVVGFIGRPDDSPYLEESTAIEWNTLEYWSIPFLQAAQAACWLRG